MNFHVKPQPFAVRHFVSWNHRKAYFSHIRQFARERVRMEGAIEVATAPRRQPMAAVPRSRD